MIEVLIFDKIHSSYSIVKENRWSGNIQDKVVFIVRVGGMMHFRYSFINVYCLLIVSGMIQLIIYKCLLFIDRVGDDSVNHL